MDAKIKNNYLLKALFAIMLSVAGVSFLAQAGFPRARVEERNPSTPEVLLKRPDCVKPSLATNSDNIFISRLLAVNGAEHKRDLSFKSFVRKFVASALRENIHQFPVKRLEDLQDPKLASTPVVLIPNNVTKEDVTKSNGIEIQTLPPLKVDNEGNIRITDVVEPNALIYLPKPYIVAGSFHRETYPHDTSAVIWALLELARENKLDNQREYIKIVRDQLDNFLFEVETFGFPLNGNRGYYASRSQTNILPKNALQYYLVTKDIDWLEKTGLLLSEKVFSYWTSKAATVSTPYGDAYKWIAHGSGPCLEVIESHEAHGFYYFKVLKSLVEYSRAPDEERPFFARGFNYNSVVEEIPQKNVLAYLEDGTLVKQGPPLLIADCETYLLDKKVSGYDANEPVIKLGGKYYKLTSQYYENDRLSRVSGYDTNHLYGPFNSFCSDFIPADHNILLYSHAKDIAKMYEIVGDTKKQEEYNKKAKKLKEMITKALWDDECGMFFELNFKPMTLRKSYPFLSSAYALFAGLFDITDAKEKEKLVRMVKFLETNLEGPAGFYASTVETGLHWDLPYVWPVQQQYIVGGLREYSEKLKELGDSDLADYLTSVADRISIKYLLSNYADWLSSNGTRVGEKVIPMSEDLLTGYANGSNYTWNLTAVLYLYETLSDHTKDAFNAIVE